MKSFVFLNKFYILIKYLVFTLSFTYMKFDIFRSRLDFETLLKKKSQHKQSKTLPNDT